MTSISGLSSTTSTYPSVQTSPRSSGRDPMAAVADALGLSSDDLKSQLQNGKSLNDIATSRGVSHDGLINAIKASLPTDATSSASGVDATAMAEKIASTNGMPPASGPRGPGGHHGHHGHGGPKGANTGIQDSSKLDGVSKLLTMNPDEVSSQASSATDLVKLLQKKGVDLGQLRNVLNSGDLVDVSA